MTTEYASAVGPLEADQDLFALRWVLHCRGDGAAGHAASRGWG